VARVAAHRLEPALPGELAPATLLICAVDPRRVTESSLAAVVALLGDGEKERLACLRLDRVRREFLVARGLARRLLSRFVAIPPEALAFALGPNGKPELANAGPSRLRFNLSHTEGLVIVAVAEGVDIGIDVEWPRRRARMLDIAERYFHPVEVAALCALPPSRRRERFFALWTLKEAYIKARGLGVPAPLRQFWLDWQGRGVRVRFDPTLGEDPAHWQLVRRRLPSGHVVAVAVARGGAPDLRVRWFAPPALEAI
jgi:4'-phosphopantetheinyl transferase